MYFFGFSNNRIVSIFLLLAILLISLAMSAYLPILEGLDETQSGGGGAQSGGETDLNKIIATINAQSNSPVETTEKKAINGIVLNDKYTEQIIDADELKKLLKNSTQVQAIMNPALPPAPN
jgi:hypothetical protein